MFVRWSMFGWWGFYLWVPPPPPPQPLSAPSSHPFLSPLPHPRSLEQDDLGFEDDTLVKVSLPFLHFLRLASPHATPPPKQAPSLPTLDQTGLLRCHCCLCRIKDRYAAFQ